MSINYEMAVIFNNILVLLNAYSILWIEAYVAGRISYGWKLNLTLNVNGMLASPTSVLRRRHFVENHLDLKQTPTYLKVVWYQIDDLYALIYAKFKIIFRPVHVDYTWDWNKYLLQINTLGQHHHER